LSVSRVAEGFDAGDAPLDDKLEGLVLGEFFGEVDDQAEAQADVDRIFQVERGALMADVREDGVFGELLASGVVPRHRRRQGKGESPFQGAEKTQVVDGICHRHIRFLFLIGGPRMPASRKPVNHLCG